MLVQREDCLRVVEGLEVVTQSAVRLSPDNHLACVDCCNKPLQGMAPTECPQSACLRTCLLACMLACLLACLLPCFLTYLLACLLAEALFIILSNNILHAHRAPVGAKNKKMRFYLKTCCIICRFAGMFSKSSGSKLSRNHVF